MNCVVYMDLRPFQCAQFLKWVKAFKAGKFSVEDDTPPGRPKTSVTKANIAAVKIVVEQDARLSVKDIASSGFIQARPSQIQGLFKDQPNSFQGL